MKERVVIVGAGFGGLRAARDLHGKGFEVLLVDRENYHLFQPLLYQVATASLEQESIAHPVRAIVRKWDDVGFRMAEVTGVDTANKDVLTARGPIPYDYLVLAAGAATNFFGNESIERHAFELKRLDHAVALRNRVLSVFERATLTMDADERRALQTFVVVGGGPTGVEFAGAVAELVRKVLPKDFPELVVEETRIVLVEMQDNLLPPYPDTLRAYTVERLERMGVEVRLGVRVVEAREDAVILDDGTTIPTHTLLWMAGVQAAPLADALRVGQTASGRVMVSDDLTLPSAPDVYVIGDMAYVEQDGEALPQMAPVAMQMGEYAARHIAARARRGTVDPFRYRDKGTMAVIGRGAAVARVLGLKLRGVIAWLAWLTLHLFMLIDFRNRLVVLLNWAYDYLAYERKVRLITGRAEADLPGKTRVVDHQEAQAQPEREIA